MVFGCDNYDVSERDVDTFALTNPPFKPDFRLLSNFELSFPSRNIDGSSITTTGA
jgi:hypothetical protein